jgi:hypothetical protein
MNLIKINYGCFKLLHGARWGIAWDFIFSAPLSLSFSPDYESQLELIK